MSRLRTNIITNRMANGAPTVSNGLVISGVTTTSDIKVGTGATLNVYGGATFSGIVTATSFVGDGSNLSNITTTTINNNADNRVITGSGTANTLNGESGLVYNGYNLAISGTGQQQLNLGSTNAGGVAIILDGDSNGDAAGGDYSIIRHNTDGDLEFFARGPAGATNTIFRQGTSEKVRIDAGGNMNVTGVVTATAFHGAFVGDFAPRNMIINGAMQVNTRESGTLTVNSSTSQFPCDRWTARGEGGSKAFTIQKTSIASSGRGVRNSVKVTSSQAASVGSHDIFNFRQKIEGFNIQRLNLGEAGCASMALSFTVRSSVAGTHSGAIQNHQQNLSYPFTYTLVANTWTDVKITIPPITSGSFEEGYGVGLILVFDLGCGSAFRGTAGQWNSSQNEGATGAVRILETNGATWEISKVQLEEGTVATPFEKKLYGEELRNCQRYCFRLGGGDTETYTTLLMGIQSHSNTCKAHVQFPVEMRSKDVSFSFSDLTLDDDIASYSDGRINSVNSEYAGKSSATIIFATASMNNVNATRILTDDVGGYIQCECEL